MGGGTVTLHCYNRNTTGHILRKAKLRAVHAESMDIALIGLHPSAIDHKLVIVLYDGVVLPEHAPGILACNIVPAVVLRCDAPPVTLNRSR